MNFFIAILINLSILSTITNAQNLVEIDLGSNWTIYNQNKSIKIDNLNAPLNLHATLLNKNIINDTLVGFNDVETRWVAEEDWIFEKYFNIDKSYNLTDTKIDLEIDSINTIASIYLNDHFIFDSRNEFLPIKIESINSHLSYDKNFLKIILKSPIRQAKSLASSYPYKLPQECPDASKNGECFINFLRKKQHSFGTETSPAVPTIGISGFVKLKFISQFDFNFYTSIYPSDLETIVDFWIANINLNINQRVNSKYGAYLFNMKINDLSFDKNETIDFMLNKTIQVIIKNSKLIKLWNPNGYGEQPLYDLTISLTNGDNITLSKTKKVGFRKVVLVESKLSGVNGSNFYYKINDIAVFLKGSNWIPTNIFKSDPSRINLLLKSCKEANFNVLRVWSGGDYELDEFYDTADQLGILIIQSFMFNYNFYPVNIEYLNNIMEEVKYQVNRLKHHPSIIAWEGNNKIEMHLFNTNYDVDLYKSDYMSLFDDKIPKLVNELDWSKSRPYLRSTPSNGASNKQTDPNSLMYGDFHFYETSKNLWDFEQFKVARFISEFGVQSYPVYTTLSSIYKQGEDISFWNKINKHRQHQLNGEMNILNEIKNNLALPNYDKNYEIEFFKSVIYLSQINQAMVLKTGSDLYRRNRYKLDENGLGNTMGVMYWHLNDLWISPTWSSIDYNLVWKMSHYYAKKSFAKLALIPYIYNKTSIKLNYVYDGLDTLNYGLTIRFLPFDAQSFTPSHTININFTANSLRSDEVKSFSLDEIKANSKCELNTENSCIVTFELVDQNGNFESRGDNFLFMNTNISQVKNMKNSNLSISNVRKLNESKSEEINFEIELNSNYISLFVWLELNSNTIGRFSENGFHMTRPTKTIIFTTNDKELCVDNLKKYLTVKSLTNVYDKFPNVNSPSRSTRLKSFFIFYYLIVSLFSIYFI